MLLGILHCHIYIVCCISDIDECKLNKCPSGSTCANYPGDFHCLCKAGYQYNSKGNTCDGKQLATSHIS